MLVLTRSPGSLTLVFVTVALSQKVARVRRFLVSKVTAR